MGIDLIYRCSDREFSIRFSLADWDMIARLSSHLPEAVQIMSGVPELGAEAIIPLGQLRAAANEIDDFLRDRADLLPYTYEFKCEYIPVGPPEACQYWECDRFGTGGQGGFRLPGDELHFYCLWAGLNECRLEKMAVGADGRGKVVEVRDMRGEREFQTANCGRVQIRKRRAKWSLRKGLAEIRKFLSTVDGPEVIKIVS
jgi:hypothetical protein